MNVPSFHQTEHFTGHPADLERFAIESASERIECAHEVGDGAVSVQVCMRSIRLLGFCEDGRISFLDHLLAEVDADQVVLKDVVVEHVFGGFTEVNDPFSHRGWTNAEGHVLRVSRAGCVVIATNSADTTCYEVSVARIFALH